MSLGGTSALSDVSNDDDERAENMQLVADLKEQVQKAEVASEQYQRQLEVLQLRLDEILNDQGRLEERDHQRDQEIQSMQLEVKELTRQKRELAQSHEVEKAMMFKEREDQAYKEGEMQAVIRRLNETVRQRDSRFYSSSERFGSARSRKSISEARPSLKSTNKQKKARVSKASRIVRRSRQSRQQLGTNSGTILSKPTKEIERLRVCDLNSLMLRSDLLNWSMQVTAGCKSLRSLCWRRESTMHVY